MKTKTKWKIGIFCAVILIIGIYAVIRINLMQDLENSQKIAEDIEAISISEPMIQESRVKEEEVETAKQPTADTENEMVNRLEGLRDLEAINEELSKLPQNINDFADLPVYVLNGQAEEYSGVEYWKVFYEKVSSSEAAHLLIAQYGYGEEARTIYSIDFDGDNYYLFQKEDDNLVSLLGEYKQDIFSDMIAFERKRDNMVLLTIVFSDQENLTQEQAEQYIQQSYEEKLPEEIHMLFFLFLRYTEEKTDM